MDHRVVSRTEDRNTVFARNRRTALRERFDVMNVKAAATLPSKAGENALRIGAEYARAEFPPGLCVIQR